VFIREHSLDGNQTNFIKDSFMKDVHAQWEALLVESANCQMISNLATDRKKRELFAKLAENYAVLAAEIERATNQRIG
jgi:hypothetical protein